MVWPGSRWSAPVPLPPAEHARRLARLRRWAWLLDGAVRLPGTRWRLGLNTVLTLPPGLGDAVGAAVSVLLVAEARRLGAPPALVGRMLLNVGVEAAGGAIPLLGDLFDTAYKANLRNVALLDAHLARSGSRNEGGPT